MGVDALHGMYHKICQVELFSDFGRLLIVVKRTVLLFDYPMGGR